MRWRAAWAVAVLIPSTALGEGLTLERAVALAIETDERARIAEQEELASEAGVDRSLAFFLPRLEVSASYRRRPFEVVEQIDGRDVVLQTKDSLHAAAAVDLTLFDGRGFPLRRSAQLARESVQASAGERKRRLGFEAAAAFLEALASEALIRASEERIASAKINVGDARARAEAQVARGSDVNRAEVELASAEMVLSLAEGARDRSRLELAFLIGGPIDALIEPAQLFEEATTSTTPKSEVRLDLVAAQRQAEALDAFASEALWRAVPSLSLHGEIFASNESGFPGRTVDGFAGVALSWTLYDGGVRYADRAERTAEAMIASLEAKQLERRSIVEVEQALASLRAARKAWMQAERAANQAKTLAESVATLYRRGLASSLEANDASLRRFEADVGLARQRTSLAEALLELRLALGLDPLGRKGG